MGVRVSQGGVSLRPAYGDAQASSPNTGAVNGSASLHKAGRRRQVLRLRADLAGSPSDGLALASRSDFGRLDSPSKLLLTRSLGRAR